MPTQNQQLTSLIPFRPDRDRLKCRIDARITRHGDIQIHHRKTISPADLNTSSAVRVWDSEY